MKFILISDTHITSVSDARKDNILETLTNKMLFILNYARKINASILQAGDFFNKSRDWETLFSIIELLNQYKDVKIYSVLGQHDLYMRSRISPSNSKILNNTKLITLLNDIPIEFENICLYGADWESKIPNPEQDKNKINILVLHSHIAKREIYPGQIFIRSSKFIRKNKGWDLILVGDVHRYFIERFEKTLLVNTGPLLRLEATSYNLKHQPKFFIYDTKNLCFLKKVDIPCKPAKSVLVNDVNVARVKRLIEKRLVVFTKEIKKELNKAGTGKKQNFFFEDNLKNFIQDNKKISPGVNKILNDLIYGEGNEF